MLDQCVSWVRESEIDVEKGVRKVCLLLEHAPARMIARAIPRLSTYVTNALLLKEALAGQEDIPD